MSLLPSSPYACRFACPTNRPTDLNRCTRCRLLLFWHRHKCDPVPLSSSTSPSLFKTCCRKLHAFLHLSFYLFIYVTICLSKPFFFDVQLYRISAVFCSLFVFISVFVSISVSLSLSLSLTLSVCLCQCRIARKDSQGRRASLSLQRCCSRSFIECI